MLKEYIMRNRLATFVVSVIVLGVALVSISMYIYYSTDAFRLDLSRPDFSALRPKVSREQKNQKSFQAQGPVDAKVLEDFLAQYKKSSDKVLQAKAFSTDVLSDSQLGLESEAK